MGLGLRRQAESGGVLTPALKAGSSPEPQDALEKAEFTLPTSSVEALWCARWDYGVEWLEHGLFKLDAVVSFEHMDSGNAP